MKFILPLMLIVFFFALEVEAECCKNKSVLKCCGKGPCNLFCCNCDNGCNRSCETDWDSYIAAAGVAAAAAAMGRRKRDTQYEHQYFFSVDSDSDGLISIGEARKYLSGHDVVKRDTSGETRPAWFAKIDANGDGFISPAEFDYTLA